MHISATDPIAPAWQRMWRLLMEPFDFKKWIAIAFCVFLVQIGQDSSSIDLSDLQSLFQSQTNPPAQPMPVPQPLPGQPQPAQPQPLQPTPNQPGPGPSTGQPAPQPTAPPFSSQPGQPPGMVPLPPGGQSGSPSQFQPPLAPAQSSSMQQFQQWISNNMTLVILIGSAILLLIIGFYVLFAWLSSRGQFMLIDNVVKDRGDIAGPWGEYRFEANQFFKFQLWIGAGYLIVLLIGGVVALTALGWSIPQPSNISAAAIATLVMTATVAGSIWFALAMAVLVVRDFVVPAMYINRIGFGDAWLLARAEVFRGNVGMVILYYLMRFVLGIPAVLLIVAGGCVVCCVSWIPILGNFFVVTVTLPVHVFFKAYALHFIAQFGPQWNPFEVSRTNPLCPSCGYDLRGNPEATACPECGYAIDPEMLKGFQI